MKRTIQVTIETSECGRYCGECEHADFRNQWCYVFDSKLVYDGEETGTHKEIWKRCAACISAEEICEPLSVSEIETILCEDDPQGARTPHGQAEAIHRAMTNKESK